MPSNLLMWQNVVPISARKEAWMTQWHERWSNVEIYFRMIVWRVTLRGIRNQKFLCYDSLLMCWTLTKDFYIFLRHTSSRAGDSSCPHAPAIIEVPPLFPSIFDGTKCRWLAHRPLTPEPHMPIDISFSPSLPMSMNLLLKHGSLACRDARKYCVLNAW